MKKKLISVIIPHYKRVDFTTRAIGSVLQQKDIDLHGVEIIVSIDGDISSEDRNIIVSQSKNVKLIHNTNEEGPGGNRQTGLSHASGEYITFLDSDDQLAPNFVSRMTPELQQNPKVTAAICLSKQCFEKGFSLFHKLRLYPLMFIRDLSFGFSLIFHQGYLYPSSFYLCQLSHMIFRVSCVKKLKFNYDYRHGGEDWDFIIKALKVGPIKIVPQQLLIFCYSPGSSTFKEMNLTNKWKSYSLLASRLSEKFRQGYFYKLFLLYIKTFGR